jgi:predicted nucleotidyltransferase
VKEAIEERIGNLRDAGKQKIPIECSRFLDSLLTMKRNQFIESIYLVGSWARGESTPSSDIDILIITEDQITKNELSKQIQRKLLSELRKLIDVKILTSRELHEAYYSLYHFLIWVYFREGIVLFGKSMVNQYPIIWDLLRNVVSDTQTHLEESRLYLENKHRYSQACVVIWNSVNTFYFIDRYLLHRDQEHPNKQSAIQMRLKKMYRKIKGIYSDISMRINNDFPLSLGGVLRYPEKIDRKYSSQEYDILLQYHELIEGYGNKIYRNLLKLIDSW